MRAYWEGDTISGHEVNQKKVDLTGKLCPFAVVEVVRRVEQLLDGTVVEFVVDDPLAAKSIPEELSEFDDIEFELKRDHKSWRVLVSK